MTGIVTGEQWYKDGQLDRADGLAVIVGIGSTLFSQFTAGFGGAQPSIDDAMAIVLAALSLLGLGIFGPGIAP